MEARRPARARLLGVRIGEQRQPKEPHTHSSTGEPPHSGHRTTTNSGRSNTVFHGSEKCDLPGRGETTKAGRVAHPYGWRGRPRPPPQRRKTGRPRVTASATLRLVRQRMVRQGFPQGNAPTGQRSIAITHEEQL